jgi:hypothetical protein
MQKLIGTIVIFSSFLFISCGENTGSHEHGGQSQNAAAEPESPADSVLKEVFVFHDEAMPKMGKLKSYEDLAKLRLDSLAKLSDAGSKALKAEYEILVAGLQRAQKGMDDWMGDFKTNKYTDKDSLLEYYKFEKAKAQAMRNDIFSVLDSARAKFGQ